MILLLLLVCASVLAISFLCSMTEAVLLSLNPLSLKLKQKQGEVVAAKWLALKNRIERPVSAILVFNTLANTGLATLAGALFAGVFGASWLWLFSVLISVAVLFLGEMAPKILGVHDPERLAPHLLGPLQWMLRICHPLVFVMEKFCDGLKSRPVKGQTASDQIMDIITLVQAAKAEQVLHNREEIIIIHAATLSARRVKNIMVPKAAVKSFDQSLSLQANVAGVGPKLHRSYPVSGPGTLGDVKGYIRVRELFLQNLTSPQADWRDLIWPVQRIDADATLTQLLALFLERHEIAALVVDAAGDVIGWVTLDDVTETLMGARN